MELMRIVDLDTHGHVLRLYRALCLSRLADVYYCIGVESSTSSVELF
jgi:hypothetical protein